MTDYGVTDEGFVLKRLADIKSDLATALATVVDPVSGETLTPDLTDEDDPFVQQINAISDALSSVWEHLQAAYNQFDPLKATKAGLSGLVQLNGLRRTEGTYGTVTVTLTGTAGKSIPSGKQVTTTSGSPIFSLPATVIGVGGTVDVVATATEKGDFDVSAGEVVKILTPVSGWTGVTNAADATAGTEEETDTELRARQQVSTANPGQTAIEAIAAGIGSLIGVEFVTIYQNITLVTDSRGLPAKTIAPVVVGGDDDEIAEVMFEKIAAGGCDTYGSEEVTITDDLNIDYVMRFSRPTETNIYVIVEITVLDSTTFPSDGEDQIKEAIVTWATEGASALNIISGYDQDGYVPGQDIYAAELYVPAYSVPGMRIDSITVSTDDSSLMDDSSSSDGSGVIIDWNEIGSFSTDNIDVVS